MRVRYEMYKNGHGIGSIAECDLTEKKARKLFEEKKHDGKCGWCELVAEDETEGGYMEIIDEYEKIKTAENISLIC